MSPSEGPPNRNWSVWRPHVVYTFTLLECLLECLREVPVDLGSDMVGMVVSERALKVESLVLV